MTKFEEMMEMVKACGEDVFFDERKEKVEITINDFEGFDDDWGEIERELIDEDKVDELTDWLDENCEHKEGDFYVYYTFKDFKVVLGSESMNI